MPNIISYLAALVTGILLTISIEILYPHARDSINLNRHAGRINWGKMWRWIVNDWKKHSPAIIMAAVFLGMAIILTIVQSFQSNDIVELIDRIDKLISVLEANNANIK